ncbi:hypothetical protein GCM10010420_06170 [Streptomyces glaucosporus]|uniref:Secreted protein n=1 Tax=Streptomyces glaucosporus TaxID=284044 RepID=A0ABN3HR62_9ACTN
MRGDARDIVAGSLVIGGFGAALGSIGWAVFTEAPALFGWAGAFAGLVLFLVGGAVAPEIEEGKPPAEDSAAGDTPAGSGNGWWAGDTYGGRTGKKASSGCGAAAGGDDGGGCGGCGCGG